MRNPRRKKALPLHARRRVDREVLPPVSNPTMGAFGGDGLGTLYVTSASKASLAPARSPASAGCLVRFARREGNA